MTGKTHEPITPDEQAMAIMKDAGTPCGAWLLEYENEWYLYVRKFEPFAVRKTRRCINKLTHQCEY